MDNFKFSELTYERPDFIEVQKKMDAYVKQVVNAKEYAEVRNAILENNNLFAEYSFAYEVAMIRNFQDCTNEFYAKEVQEIAEKIILLDTTQLFKAILDSEFKHNIEEEFGKEYLEILKSKLNLHSNGKELMVQEQELVVQYQQLKANLKIKYEGKIYSEAELNKLHDSKDKEVRKATRIAKYKVLLEHKDEFEDILNGLIHIRNEIAKVNGYDSYLDYMNEEKGRRGYGEVELNAFCQQVKKDLVPFTVELRKAQARRLGVEKLGITDYSIIFPDGNPEPIGDDVFLLNAASEMYRSLSKETEEFYDLMLEHELMDVKASPNKISNMGFALDLEKIKLPYVFGNCNGTIYDVVVFTHELGHAFQGYLSMKEQALSEYYTAVNDVAEIPSKAMEQFAYPYAEKFFGEAADKFRFLHLQQALFEICDYSEVNEFESWVYSHPESSLEEKAKKYEELEKMYDPSYDNSELIDYIEAGCKIINNMALYMFPKYVISYALSAMCALQFGKRMVEDKESTWNDYLKLCSAGGSKSYPELLKLANLSPAYEDGTVASATEYAKKILMDYIEKETTNVF